MAEKSAKPPLTREAYIEARIERAMARHGAMPPALAEEVRRALHFALTTHPQAQELIQRLRPRVELPHSDDVAIAADESQSDAKRKGKAQ